MTVNSENLHISFLCPIDWHIFFPGGVDNFNANQDTLITMHNKKVMVTRSLKIFWPSFFYLPFSTTLWLIVMSWLVTIVCRVYTDVDIFFAHIFRVTHKKVHLFRCKYPGPLISLKKCSMSKRNIFMLVFISTMSQISRLNIVGDIQQIRNAYLIFYV